MVSLPAFKPKVARNFLISVLGTEKVAYMTDDDIYKYLFENGYRAYKLVDENIDKYLFTKEIDLQELIVAGKGFWLQ